MKNLNKTKAFKDGSTKVERTPHVCANFGETETEFYFQTTLKKCKGMLEFYELQRDRLLCSDKVQIHEIIHMLGYHASIQKSTDIKQDQKYQRELTEENHVPTM